MPGLETTLPLLYSEGVVRRGLPLGTLLQVLCAGPAARYGLAPRKGAIAVGADADLVIFDPDEQLAHRRAASSSAMPAGARTMGAT